MKLYIKAMSLPRKQAIERLDSLSMKVSEHVIKCVVYGKHRSTDLNGWISEIATWIHSADKPNIVNAKLKEKDYKDSIFGQFGTDFYDAEDNLSFFEANNLYKREGQTFRLPYFKINNEIVKCLFECYNQIKSEVIPMLMDKESHSKLFWNNVVEAIIKSHLYDLSEEDIVEDLDHIE